MTERTTYLRSNVKRRRRWRRTSEEKYGKYKWIKTLIRRNSEELREIKRMLRGISYGLRHLMDFDSQYLIDMVCGDSRDEAVLDVLRAAGSNGCLQKRFTPMCVAMA